MGRGNSRNFQAAVLLFLAAMLLLGVALRASLKGGLNRQAFAELENNATVISELMPFIINLDLAARISGTDAIVCDDTGRIVLCSESPTGCIHQGYNLTQEYLQSILDQGGSNDISTLLNLYDDVRYLSAKPCSR